MKYLPLLFLLFLSILGHTQTRYDVASVAEFNSAQDQASAGDTIVWAPGTYADVGMSINKDGLIVTALPHGTVLFKGVSRATINANEVTFSGFQYVGGYIATLDVIRVYGNDVLISHVNIQNYTCFKYLVVYEESRRTTISHCNFENRLNLDDKNILSVLVDNEPGFHKIQHCSFKNFDGIGNDQGIEPIRIGVSTQGDLDSRTLVEYCYFTKCNGDGEIISHKSRQNVYRYNTFENNPVAELVLRHGDEGIVYGNFFLNNMGGIRVREGSNHFIYNNYFEGLNNRTIYLQNDPSDPLSEIHIYHNTIINSDEVRLGSNGSNPPTNVTLANNVFINSAGSIFSEDTEDETWIGNLYTGDLGIDLPTTGLTDMDPELVQNPEGFYQPAAASPVIGAASADYPAVPLYPGMDYDNEILLDLMQEPRPLALAERAVGASEFSAITNIQPFATELNSGPSYLFDNLVEYIAANTGQVYVGGGAENRSVVVSSNIDWSITSSEPWMVPNLTAGSGDSSLDIAVEANPEAVNRSGTITITGGTESVTITIFQDAGGPLSVAENLKDEILIFPNPTEGKLNLSALPSDVSDCMIKVLHMDGKVVFFQEYPIDRQTTEIDLNQLPPGTYLLQVQFLRQNGSLHSELSRTIVRK